MMINISKLYNEYLKSENNEHLNKIFSVIIKYVREYCPNQRRPKYPSLYYLINIHTVLKDNVLWKSLNKSKFCLSKNKTHYKTIADAHRLWCKHGVYEKAYREIVAKNIVRSTNGEIKLFIDATSIIDKLGSEKIGYGTETRKNNLQNRQEYVMNLVLMWQLYVKMAKQKLSSLMIRTILLEHLHMMLKL